MVAIKKFKESDDNERVRKTALREVRILKVSRSHDLWQGAKTHSLPIAACLHQGHYFCLIRPSN